MVDPMISIADLAVWCQQGIADDDLYAQAVIERASVLIRFYAGKKDTEWVTDLPDQIKTLCLIVCRRVYLNPDQEISTTTGPIGARVADAAAAGMTLTDDEIDQCRTAAGLDPIDATQGNMWLLRLAPTPSAHTALFRDGQDPLGVSLIPWLNLRQDGFAYPPELLP